MAPVKKHVCWDTVAPVDHGIFFDDSGDHWPKKILAQWPSGNHGNQTMEELGYNEKRTLYIIAGQ